MTLLERFRQEIAGYCEVGHSLTCPAKSSAPSPLQPLTHSPASLIIQTLADFGVLGSIGGLCLGPRLNTYQLSLAPGTKINKAIALKEELAAALAVPFVHVHRPRSKRYVAVEVPRPEPLTVTLADLSLPKSDEIVLPVGVSTTGKPVTLSLSKALHILAGGATGSGKSAFLNALICFLIQRHSSHKLQFIMIDPKMVELIAYNSIPHLIQPVITDMDQVKGALTWGVAEMERRYKLLAEAGHTEIKAYNQWAKANNKEILSTIVIIIDELADLMMTTDDIEVLIVRLAQKARAIGIHLILATQHPIVKVVTGLIKANVPTRIAFAVTSHVASRVILDAKGAETLLGAGDMLYQAPNVAYLQRLQGYFVSPRERLAIIQRLQNTILNKSPVTNTIHHPPDELLDKAIKLVVQEQYASTPFLQRRLRITYTRAANLMEAMKKQGLLERLKGL